LAAENSLLLVELCFCQRSPGFISRVHLASFAIMLPNYLKYPTVCGCLWRSKTCTANGFLIFSLPWLSPQRFSNFNDTPMPKRDTRNYQTYCVLLPVRTEAAGCHTDVRSTCYSQLFQLQENILREFP
jgi:hypothetical protein